MIAATRRHLTGRRAPPARDAGLPSPLEGDLREVICLLRERGQRSPDSGHGFRIYRGNHERTRQRREPSSSTGDSSSRSFAPRRRRRFQARSRSRTPRRGDSARHSDARRGRDDTHDRAPMSESHRSGGQSDRQRYMTYRWRSSVLFASGSLRRAAPGAHTYR